MEVSACQRLTEKLVCHYSGATWVVVLLCAYVYFGMGGIAMCLKV